jgi:serine/threonine-protein phosphatase 6 regulatory ankyrin repeat subunit B
MIQANLKNTKFKVFSVLFVFFFILPFAFCNYSNANDYLIKAIKDNNYDNFKVALKHGADPNAKDTRSYPILLFVLSAGQEQMAIDLILKGANINDSYNFGTNTIYLAINNRLSKVADLLINRGVDISLIRQDGTNLLMIAVSKDMREVALNIISKNKLDINAVNKRGDTALSLALNKNYLNMANLLYEQGAKPRNIFEAIPIKDTKSARKFIEDKEHLKLLDKVGNSPLHIAYIYGNYQIASLILKEGIIDVNLKNNFNLTPLMIAAMNNNTDLISLAMGYGANVLIPDINGLTPLMYAVFYRNYDLIERILKYNKHAALSIDNDGSSPFSYAVGLKDKKICEKLLQIKGVINQNKAKSPLSIAIANLDQYMTKFLLDKGVKINVRGCFGMMPLSMAIKMNLEGLVKFLLSQGAKPTLKDRDGFDSIYYANLYGNQNIIDLVDTNKQYEYHVDYYKK